MELKNGIMVLKRKYIPANVPIVAAIQPVMTMAALAAHSSFEGVVDMVLVLSFCPVRAAEALEGLWRNDVMGLV